MTDQLDGSVKDTLNCLEENIFFIDLDLRIAWMNRSANKLIETLKVHFGEKILGTPLSTFIKNSFHKDELLKGKFPIDVELVLFDTFAARFILNELVVKGKKLGYLLTWKDVTEREKEKERMKAMLAEWSTPILQTVAEHTLLVPLIGELTLERLETLATKLLNECLKNETEYVILDFSGATTIKDNNLGQDIQKLTNSIELMGAKVLYCGFPKDMVKNMVSLGVHTNQQTFVSFRNAIRYVVAELEN
ncbi:hypothetical protein AWM68_18815 [Fictibacillus phosphorivorans]|uniref:STAS domain-containing protein n=1 Tax=Fictibacillus phosphorivorans TaxID=1221500 RepID=A0A163RZH5_9BACL|nr:hypothetical protein [Fictibacillus phosphorivorans]KZE67819.1 hypothetical protein AWM68_18815 [Fictibacillus phosphorivorans]